MKDRAKLAATLNSDGRYPTISEHSSVGDLCGVLQQIDRNGSHTAELAAKDGYGPYTLDEAWEQLANLLEG